MTKKNQIVDCPDAEALAAFKHNIHDEWVARHLGQEKPPQAPALPRRIHAQVAEKRHVARGTVVIGGESHQATVVPGLETAGASTEQIRPTVATPKKKARMTTSPFLNRGKWTPAESILSIRPETL